MHKENIEAEASHFEQPSTTDYLSKSNIKPIHGIERIMDIIQLIEFLKAQQKQITKSAIDPKHLTRN